MNKALFTLMSVVLLVELVVRLSGITDYPLYDADNKIGYIPKASQSGSFLNIHDWAFNTLHMGVAEEFKTSAALDTLLVSDSIVYGGNHLKQQEKLPAQLELLIGGKVWPISAQSWGLRNELAYLKQHPDVVKQVDQIIFILNSGDFDIASSWSCDLTHPRAYTEFRVVYFIKKYVHNWQPCTQVLLPEYKVPDGDWHTDLANFMQTPEVQGKKIVFFLYPNKAQESDKKTQVSAYESHAVEIKAITHAEVYNIGRDSRWNTAMYRDEIHPIAQGNSVLAQIIKQPAATDRL